MPLTSDWTAVSGSSRSSMYREMSLEVRKQRLDGLTTSERAMTLRRGRAADLYQQHAADAVQLAYLLTGNEHVAEDLVQDAFVRLFGKFQDLRRPEAFAFYLRRTVVNLSRDHFRRMQRERALLRRQRSPEITDTDQLTRVDTHDELLHALQALPPRQRAAVVLRFCEGLSEQEAADVLQTSVRALNSLVSRGLTTLRRQVRSKDSA
jgi:RNA polymerase sigma-70 factor (sigma-E family)